MPRKPTGKPVWKRPERPICIGIVGSRRRDTDADFMLLMAKFVELFQPGDTLVSGGCPKGGDRFAEEIAKAKGFSITIHYPNWSEEGISAGFQRNTKIVEQCDVLIAIVADDRKGGTEDSVKKAQKLGKPVILV